jgi:phage tail sheath protein FI
MTYGRPGVYVNERLLPAPIAVTGTANAAGAVVGAFAQGPEAVTLVTSWYDFVKKFGGYNASFKATFGVGAFFQNGGSELFVKRVLASDAAAATSVLPRSGSGDAIGSVTARNRGDDGNFLRFQLFDSVGSTFNFVVYRETAASAGDNNPANDVILEQYFNVVLDDEDSNDYIETVVNASSEYVTVSITDNETAPTESRVPLTGGNNGAAVVAADYVDALADFGVIERPLVMFAPEIMTILGASSGKTVQDGLVSFASSNNHFAVLDTVAGLTPAQAVTYAASMTATSNAAVYYPHIFTSDPLGRSSAALRLTGPAGAMAGMYLFTDRQTGPFKAPAGVRASVRGAVAPERTFTSAELDALNSAVTPVNALRSLPGAGIVAMGARTLLQDGTANRYVNMRRSLIYVRKSLEDLTQFALFENNDERLWARLRTSISVFLTGYLNQGGLRGTTPAEAFFVKVDSENNPANSIANGEVHIEIGVALQYPAEFVVINLSQKTAA